MATISKANRPRKAPGMTHNGRVRLRSRSIAQLEDMYSKASDKKSKGKILNELNRQKKLTVKIVTETVEVNERELTDNWTVE